MVSLLQAAEWIPYCAEILICIRIMKRRKKIAMKKNYQDKLSIAMFGQKNCDRSGGVEVVVVELSKRMAAMGYDVTCFNRSMHCDGSKITEYMGVKEKYVPTINRKGLAAVSSSFCAALACALGKYNVVHIHAEGPAVMCWLPKLFGKRVIVTVHGLDWKREKWSKGFGAAYIHFGERCMVKFADEIIVLSKRLRQYFADTYGRDTQYISNGVERPVLIEPELIRERYGVESQYFLSVSRLVPEKRIDLLIEAFRNVKTDKKLIIAGGSSDTDVYIRKLKSMAAGDERIIFTGFVQGRLLAELYSNAYVYVLPSDLEGMPLSLLEAMSYGNCCLTSDIAECSEVVENKAMTFKKNDVEDLSNKLQFLCDHPEDVKRYREDAADFICGKYDWDDVVSRTLERYKRYSRYESINEQQVPQVSESFNKDEINGGY